MTLRTIARRYANALYDVVAATGGTDAPGRQLAAFNELVQGHRDLRRAFESPAVPPARKRALMAGLLDAAGDVGAEVRRTLLLLAEHDRIGILPDVVACYAERQRADAHVVPAEIVTAEGLAEGRRAALAQALGRTVDAEVTLSERVDPAIIGGFVARVGSVVYDASVARQLERLRQQLVEGR